MNRQYLAVLALLAVVAWVALPGATVEARAVYPKGPYDEAYVRANAMHAAAAPSTATTTELIAAPGAGLRIVVIEAFAQAEGTQDVTFLSATTALTCAVEMADGDTVTKGPLRCAQNEAFQVTTTGAVVINVDVTYVVVED